MQNAQSGCCWLSFQARLPLFTSAAAVSIHFPCVGGKLTAPHGHSTRPTIRKVSFIASQLLKNRCSSSTSPLPDFFPPQGPSAAQPLLEGGPATSSQRFDKPRSLQRQLCHCMPGAAGSRWGQHGAPRCWFSCQEQRDKLQLLRKNSPFLNSTLGPATTIYHLDGPSLQHSYCCLPVQAPASVASWW